MLQQFASKGPLLHVQSRKVTVFFKSAMRLNGSIANLARLTHLPSTVCWTLRQVPGFGHRTLKRYHEDGDRSPYSNETHQHPGYPSRDSGFGKANEERESCQLRDKGGNYIESGSQVRVLELGQRLATDYWHMWSKPGLNVPGKTN